MRGLAAVAARASPVAALRAQPLRLHQPRHAMLAAALAELAQVVGHLAVAVDAAALEPGLLDSTQQAPVVDGSRRVRCRAPGVVAARMHIQDLAQAPHRMRPLMVLDERVPHPDCLAKYAAAFFRISRSSVTRRSSA